jgi:hypothetical protein
MSLAGAFWFGYVFFAWETHHALRQAIAEADRTDPGWRWHDLQAKRTPVPDKENGALQVLRVAKNLPEHWWPFRKTLKFPNDRPIRQYDRDDLIGKFDVSLMDLSPPTLLNTQQLAALEDELKEYATALAEARKLVVFTRGRYPVPPKQASWASSNEAQLAARHVANLLKFDAVVQAHRGQLDKSLECCCGILHIGKVVGNEPDFMSPPVRLAQISTTLSTLERCLAQGTATDAELARAQNTLTYMEKDLPFVEMARVDRATIHAMFEEAASSKANNKEFVNMLFFAGKTGNPAREIAFKYFRDMERLWADRLHKANMCVATAKSKDGKRHKALKALAKQCELSQCGWVIDRESVFLPRLSFPQYAMASLRWQVKLRAASVAVAVERYRLAKGNWPDKLADLVPKFLPEVPADLYGKGPLLLRKKKDHVVIYSVGADGSDDGGRLESEDPKEYIPGPDFVGLDFGFRLWNVAARRQPALPPVRIPDSFPPADKD